MRTRTCIFVSFLVLQGALRFLDNPINPLLHNPSTGLQRTTFEKNILGKEENVGNAHFLLPYKRKKKKSTFNPLPDDKILDWSKLKQIADDILKCIENGK